MILLVICCSNYLVKALLSLQLSFILVVKAMAGRGKGNQGKGNWWDSHLWYGKGKGKGDSDSKGKGKEPARAKAKAIAKVEKAVQTEAQVKVDKEVQVDPYYNSDDPDYAYNRTCGVAGYWQYPVPPSELFGDAHQLMLLQ